MDRIAVIDRAKAILGADLADQLDPDTWDALTDEAVTVDAAGRLPTDTGWEPTYEPYWLAATAVDALALRGLGESGVTRFTSEGATFELTGPSLDALAARLRARSPITALLNGGTGIGFIDVPRRPLGYHPTSGRQP